MMITTLRIITYPTRPAQAEAADERWWRRSDLRHQRSSAASLLADPL